jgi:ribosomal protein S18 acetylase RimI-like enzyme
VPRRRAPDLGRRSSRCGRVRRLPAGFVVVAIHDEPHRGEIYMVAVDPDYQNRGIGLNLVTFAVDRITELGIPLAEIGTGGDQGHAPARHVYEKAGFTPVPLVRYYKALPGDR